MRRFNKLQAGILFLLVAGWSSSAYADLSAYAWIDSYVYADGPEPYTFGENRQTYAYLHDGDTYEDSQSGAGGAESSVEGTSGGSAWGYGYGEELYAEAYAVSPDGSATQARAQGVGEWSFQVLDTEGGQGRLMTAYVDYYTGFNIYTENPGDWANGATQLSAVLTNTSADGVSVSGTVRFYQSAVEGEQWEWEYSCYDDEGPLALSLFFNEGDFGTLRVETGSQAEAGACAVPVPGAFLLGSLGLGVAGWLQRRRS